MSLLHTEARGYLPIGSAAYRPHSARQLAEDSRMAQSSFSRKATQRWDRLRTLVRMVRTGDRSAGVPALQRQPSLPPPAYPAVTCWNGQRSPTFYLAPALAAISYETRQAPTPQDWTMPDCR